jgi:long-subunit fatty acid transport protein
VRYYGSSETHALFETDTLGRSTVADSTGTISTPLPFQTALNSWRDVVNVSVGGNVQVSPAVRIHAGFNTDESPVDDPETSVFRRVNLVAFSSGVSFTVSQFSGALGFGYSTGESDAITIVRDQNGEPLSTTLRVKSFRISYAVAFTF